MQGRRTGPQAHSGPSRGRHCHPAACSPQATPCSASGLSSSVPGQRKRHPFQHSTHGPPDATTYLGFPHSRGLSLKRTRSHQQGHTADPPGRPQDTGAQGLTQPPWATHMVRRGPHSQHRTRKPQVTSINGHSGLCPLPPCAHGLRNQRPQLTHDLRTAAGRNLVSATIS